MKKYLITDLAKGNANISADQVLEIGAGGGTTGDSYSTDETETGGTWIDGKPIYTITQLTADPAPTVDIMIKSTVVGGTYTEYEYTKP